MRFYPSLFSCCSHSNFFFNILSLGQHFGPPTPTSTPGRVFWKTNHFIKEKRFPDRQTDTRAPAGVQWWIALPDDIQNLYHQQILRACLLMAAVVKHSLSFVLHGERQAVAMSQNDWWHAWRSINWTRKTERDIFDPAMLARSFNYSLPRTDELSFMVIWNVFSFNLFGYIYFWHVGKNILMNITCNSKQIYFRHQARVTPGSTDHHMGFSNGTGLLHLQWLQQHGINFMMRHG